VNDAVPAAEPAVDAGETAHRRAGQRGDSPLGAAIAAIWIRELRARMRGKKAFIFLTFYLSLLVGLLWLALRGAEQTVYLGALQQVEIGRGIFTAVIFIETLVVVALAPAYTAGAISQEHERQTFDLLSVTPITSLSIVAGKLLSSLSYLVLLIGLSIPIASVAFFFGGIGAEIVLAAYALLVVTAIGYGALGVACSAVAKRTQPATVAAFLITVVLVVGATAAWGVMTGMADAERRPRPPDALLLLNPFVAQADLLCAATASTCLTGITVGVDGARDGNFPPPDLLALEAGGFWPRSLASFLALAGVMIAVATQALAPSRRLRLSTRRRAAAEPPR